MQYAIHSLQTSLPWHVVHTKPRAEARALENLERQGFEVFLPMITLQKVRRAKLANVTEPMFSRYLFLRTTLAMEDLSVVRSTLGVSQLVRFGTVPAKVPHAWVEAMRAEPAVQETLHQVHLGNFLRNCYNHECRSIMDFVHK